MFLIDSQFSIPEIIFWYVALVLLIIIFVVYKKKTGSNKKRLNRYISRIEKNIKEIDNELNLINSNQNVKEFKKGYISLSTTEAFLIELYENTKLQDINKALNQIRTIEKASKKPQDDKTDYKKYLLTLKKEYNKLLDMLVVIINIIK